MRARRCSSGTSVSAHQVSQRCRCCSASRRAWASKNRRRSWAAIHVLPICSSTSPRDSSVNSRCQAWSVSRSARRVAPAGRGTADRLGGHGARSIRAGRVDGHGRRRRTRAWSRGSNQHPGRVRQTHRQCSGVATERVQRRGDGAVAPRLVAGESPVRHGLPRPFWHDVQQPGPGRRCRSRTPLDAGGWRPGTRFRRPLSRAHPPRRAGSATNARP